MASSWLDRIVPHSGHKLDGMAAAQAGHATMPSTPTRTSGRAARSSATQPTGCLAWSPETFGVTLLPYQLAGLDYIHDTPAPQGLTGRRCIVADEMGLGKTVEALAAIHLEQAYPVLIVCPASLKLNWEREVRRCLPGIRASVDACGGQVVITNYERLASLDYRPWRALIVDEAHYVKDRRTQRAGHILRLSRTPTLELVLLLTGTPIINRPLDLASLLEIVGTLHEYGGFWEYVKRFCDAYQGQWGWDLSGATNLPELNKRLRNTCYLRRLKADVLPQLPAKRRAVVTLPISNAAAYREAEREWYGAGGELLKLGELRQVAAAGKVKAATSWIEGVLEQGEKLVVFTWHRATAETIAGCFDAPCITGDTPLKERDRLVQRFQTDTETRLIVLTIATGGLGLTLTAASNVAFLELPWTPAALEQAEDRLHRIGQRDVVTSWLLLSNTSIDQQMYALLDEKQAVVKAGTDGVTDTSAMRIVAKAIQAALAA